MKCRLRTGAIDNCALPNIDLQFSHATALYSSIVQPTLRDMRHSSRDMSPDKSRRSVVALQLSQTDERPTVNYDYDEKAAYEQHCRQRRSKHSKHNSYDSKSSVSSSTASFDDEKYVEDAVPRYAHAFYNRIDDKPLPLLPGSQTRRVRFVPRTNVADKPLPPLCVRIIHP
jgi:hypothetical protein